jgi:hypothetical protein
MYHLDLAKYQAKDFVLREELEDLERRGWNRLPVLDNERPKYIVHLSMVDRFLRRRAYQGASVNELTLAQLLGDDKLEKTFAETWITVPKTVSIGEAEKLRRSKRGCQDLFVTENRDPAEPVLRWLTDGEIASAMDEIT